MRHDVAAGRGSGRSHNRSVGSLCAETVQPWTTVTVTTRTSSIPTARRPLLTHTRSPREPFKPITRIWRSCKQSDAPRPIQCDGYNCIIISRQVSFLFIFFHSPTYRVILQVIAIFPGKINTEVKEKRYTQNM